MKTATHEMHSTDFFDCIWTLDQVQGKGNCLLADQWDVRYLLYMLGYFARFPAVLASPRVTASLDTGRTPAWSRYPLPHTTIGIRHAPPYVRAVRENAPRTDCRRWYRFRFRVYLADAECGSMYPLKVHGCYREDVMKDEGQAVYVPYHCRYPDTARDWTRESVTLDMIRRI